MSDDFAPIFELSDLVNEVARARSGGSTIVLANGCFDLFHVGHVRYLAGAKALGGTLVVGINSDRQARSLKGEGRPFVPETKRAELVYALLFAHPQTLFSHPTPTQLHRP